MTAALAETFPDEPLNGLVEVHTFREMNEEHSDGSH
jgi:hypothetical protein